MKIIKDEKNRLCLVTGGVEHTLDRETALRLSENILAYLWRPRMDELNYEKELCEKYKLAYQQEAIKGDLMRAELEKLRAEIRESKGFYGF